MLQLLMLHTQHECCEYKQCAYFFVLIQNDIHLSGISQQEGCFVATFKGMGSSPGHGSHVSMQAKCYIIHMQIYRKNLHRICNPHIVRDVFQGYQTQEKKRFYLNIALQEKQTKNSYFCTCSSLPCACYSKIPFAEMSSQAPHLQYHRTQHFLKARRTSASGTQAKVSAIHVLDIAEEARFSRFAGVSSRSADFIYSVNRHTSSVCSWEVLPEWQVRRVESGQSLFTEATPNVSYMSIDESPSSALLLPNEARLFSLNMKNTPLFVPGKLLMRLTQEGFLLFHPNCECVYVKLTHHSAVADSFGS